MLKEVRNNRKKKERQKQKTSLQRKQRNKEKRNKETLTTKESKQNDMQMRNCAWNENFNTPTFS